jgi:hypothetical protein
MKRSEILVFLFILVLPAMSQRALVLKDQHNGRAWAIKKGKNLSVSSWTTGQYPVEINMTGRLADLTDSSFTLVNERGYSEKTFLFNDVSEVQVIQSGAGQFASYTCLGIGFLAVIYSPWAYFGGTDENPSSHINNFVTCLSIGLAMTGLGICAVLPYMNSYDVSGVCHTSNGIFLRNRNGTYYFSLATGMGDSYGGLGFRAQARFGRIMGVGVHTGVGWLFPYLSNGDNIYIDGNSISVMTGVKFFAYRGWYLDVQFGNFGRIGEIYHVGDQVVVRNLRTPYGFVFTAGGDWFLSRTFGLNFGLGTALDLTAPNSSNTFPAFDMGFIIKW